MTKKNIKKGKRTRKKLRTIRQVGGAGIAAIQADIIKRCGVFGEESKIIETIGRLNDILSEDQEITNPNIQITVEGLMSLGKDNIPNLSINEPLIKESQITFIPTHGTHKNNNIGTVPNNTIICFLGVMGEFTLNRIGNSDDSILQFFNNMDEETFQDILVYRNLYNKHNLEVSSKLYYDAFRCSTWYYPSDIYPDIELSVGPDDYNMHNNFTPINLFISPNPSKQGVMKLCGRELCGSDFFGKDFKSTVEKIKGFNISLSDGLSNLKTVTQGFRVVILTACRDMYHIPFIEGKKMLERELYYYHLNYNLDETSEKLVKKSSKFCLNSTKSMRHKIIETNIDTRKTTDFDFRRLNSKHNIHFYNGRTGSLIDLKRKAKQTGLDDNDLRYLSTFSIHKIILFFNNLEKVKSRKFFSCCISKSTREAKMLWSNAAHFFAFCITNSGSTNYFINKIDNMITFLSTTLPGLNVYCLNSTNITQMIDDITYLLTRMSTTLSKQSKPEIQKRIKILDNIKESKSKKRIQELRKSTSDRFIRITVEGEFFKDYYGETIQFSLKNLVRHYSHIYYIKFKTWNPKYNSFIASLPNLNTIHIDNCTTRVNLNSRREIHILVTGNRNITPTPMFFYGNIVSLEIENNSLDMELINLDNLKLLNSIKFTDCNLTNLTFIVLQYLTELKIQGGIISFKVLNSIFENGINLESIDIQEVDITDITNDGKLNYQLNKLNKKLFIDTRQNSELSLPYHEIYQRYNEVENTNQQGILLSLSIYIVGIQNSIATDGDELYKRFLTTGYL